MHAAGCGLCYRDTPSVTHTLILAAVTHMCEDVGQESSEGDGGRHDTAQE